MAELAALIGETLEDATVNPDSPPRLLKALRRSGILVESTSRWELGEIEHPVVEPLLAYKKLARLYTANGWAWLASGCTRDASDPSTSPAAWSRAAGRRAAGSPADPAEPAPAVRADEGWTLICADVAQLEPRVLAAMSKDRAMAAAARRADLYEGVVRSGAVQTRQEAKYAVLGAMYGATTGPSGQLGPRLRSVFPGRWRSWTVRRRRGGQGVVSTLLGRSSPRPDALWTATQSRRATRCGRRRRAAGAQQGQGSRPVHPQLRGAGHRGRMVAAWLAEIRHR
jgi:DNA polymerase-1